jgi:LTR polyprotein gag-polypeptide-like protein
MDSPSTLPTFYKCRYGIVELLSDYNYLDWSETLIQFLTADETWDIVQGVTTRPPNSNTRRDAHNEELQQFRVLSAKACGMILSACSTAKKRSVLGKTDPKEIWDTLKAQNNSTSTKAGAFLLRSRFLKEKFDGNGPISTFLSKIRSYQTQLSSTSRAISDDDLISQVLADDALPKRFEQTVKYLQLQADFSWDNLVQILIDEDRQSPLNPESKSTTTPTSALISRSQKYSSKSKEKKRQKHQDSDDERDNRHSKRRSKESDSETKSDSDDEDRCFHCCRRGHLIKDCRIKKQADKMKRRYQKREAKANASANMAQAKKPCSIADATFDSTLL